MRGRARRGLRARMGVREGWEAAGRLQRAWVGHDPAGAEPRAGSHSSDARRSQLCARGIGELEGRRRWGCCCYCDYRGRCGGLRRFKVSGSAPRGRCRGWRVGNPRGSRGPGGQAMGRVWESLCGNCPGTLNCSCAGLRAQTCTLCPDTLCQWRSRVAGPLPFKQPLSSPKPLWILCCGPIRQYEGSCTFIS